MDVDMWSELSLIILSLLFSAFFVSTEAAYISMGEFKIKQLIQSKGKSAHILNLWIKHPNKMLNTILMGTVLSNVAGAVVAGNMAFNHFNKHPFFAAVVAMAATILVFGEIIPRSIARNNPGSILIFNTYILRIIFYLFYPVAWVMNRLTVLVYTIFGNEIKSADRITEDDLAFLIEEQGILEEQKQQMLANIFDIYDTQAKEVMVPRTDMVAVASDSDKFALMALLKENEYSRIPVYENTLDNIIGILHIKDLLKLSDGWGMEDLLKTIHDAKFVPETKKIDVLLREFQRERQQMAVVVDEYGGVAGIITMEDVLEEIVGEIRDEYDADEKEFEVQEISENHYRVDAIMNISDFCDYFLLERTDDMSEYDTVGGLVFDIAAAIPSVGDEFEWRDFKIVVHSMKNNKLETVDFIRIDKPGGQESEDDESNKAAS